MSGNWFRDRLLYNSKKSKNEHKELKLQIIDKNIHEPYKIESNWIENGENLSPKQFLEKYSLPRIVRVIPEEPIDSQNRENAACLLGGKLIIYKKYRGGKIEAKNFGDNKINSKHNEHSIPKEPSAIVVIPDTYQGWFSVVTERGQVKARVYTSIQRLITAQVTAFLVIGPDLTGYVQNHRKSADGMRHQYSKLVVKSGQVLKLLAVYQDIADQSAKSKRLSWPLLGARQETTQYAQCTTATKQVVYIPITAHGSFYAVSTANNTAEDNVSKVYQISKLLRVFPLPVRVSTVAPNKSQGSMLLESYHKEDVMLACTLDSNRTNSSSSSNNKFRFLEIDINSKFYISRVPDEHRLFKSHYVQDALRNCYENSEKWCQQLKIIHHIYPQNNNTQNSIRDNNENSKPIIKRTRKLSLGDKKTVKSASFRFSTSYGPDDTRPLYRNLADNEINSQTPRYLNITNKATEECCSSLPVQKVDRNAFDNAVSSNGKQSKPSNKNHINFLNGERLTNQPKINPIDRLNQLTNNQPIIIKRNTEQVANVSNNYQQHVNGIQIPRTVVTKKYENRPNTQHNIIKCRSSSDAMLQSAQNSTRYKVIKKPTITTSYNKPTNEQNLSKPMYKTRLKIQIDCPYADVVDAIETSNSSNEDNIYAEINDCYPSEYFSLNCSQTSYRINNESEASSYSLTQCSTSHAVS